MAKAIIIGAGIIGLSSAYYLQKAGFEVEILEKGDLTNNCSFGNMGYLSPSHIIPLAAPGMVEQGILWMFDRKSPFYIRPELSLRLVRWGWQFLRSSTRAHVERNVRPLAELLFLSRDLYFEWLRDENLQIELVKKGCIIWYQSESKRDDEIETARAGEKVGLEFEIIESREAAARLEPDLPPEVIGGVHYLDDAHLQPQKLMRQLQALLERRGVKISKNCEVAGFEKGKNGRISAVLTTDGQRHESDLVVLAAGSWSPEVAQLAGESLSLMPAKGYSMDIQNPTKRLNYPCIFKEAKVALTPFDEALRIGSTLEIGKINSEIMLPRVQGILEGTARFMPSMMDDPQFRQLMDVDFLRKNLRQRVWFGFRPMSPDGMPYIGFSPKIGNLIYATGGAMIGLSMGAGVGKLVSELASGKQPSMDLAAFRLDRFFQKF